MRPAVDECNPGAGDEILDGARDEHLLGAGDGRYTRAYMDCASGNLLCEDFTLACVDAGA